MSIIRPLDGLRDDVRFALRMLRRSPAFTAVALASLALGIGANTAIFGLIDTLMLRALPVRDPHQLVEILSVYPGDPRMNGSRGNTTNATATRTNAARSRDPLWRTVDIEVSPASSGFSMLAIGSAVRCWS